MSLHNSFRNAISHGTREITDDILSLIARQMKIAPVSVEKDCFRGKRKKGVLSIIGFRYGNL